MTTKIVVKKEGIGFCGALTIVFIVLQLMNVIDWPWYWLIAPLWIPTALVLSVPLALGAVALFCWVLLQVYSYYEAKKRKAKRENGTK